MTNTTIFLGLILGCAIGLVFSLWSWWVSPDRHDLFEMYQLPPTSDK